MRTSNFRFDKEFNFLFSIYRVESFDSEPVLITSFSLLDISLRQARRIAKEISSNRFYICTVRKF